jgi:hypothetical protein
VREERAERNVHVEHREDSLPAPGREHEADEGEQQPEPEEEQRAGVRVLGLDVVGRDLGDEQGQQGGADDDPHPELGGAREVEQTPSAARASSLGGRHSLMLRVRSPAVPPVVD